MKFQEHKVYRGYSDKTKGLLWVVELIVYDPVITDVKVGDGSIVFARPLHKDFLNDYIYAFAADGRQINAVNKPNGESEQFTLTLEPVLDYSYEVPIWDKVGNWFKNLLGYPIKELSMVQTDYYRKGIVIETRDDEVLVVGDYNANGCSWFNKSDVKFVKLPIRENL